MPSFKAFRIHERGRTASSRASSSSSSRISSPGDVVIRVTLLRHQLQGRARGHGRGKDPAPLSAGGRHRSRRRGRVVERSRVTRPGDRVLVTGYELSETHDGGYAEYARVQGDG